MMAHGGASTGHASPAAPHLDPPKPSTGASLGAALLALARSAVATLDLLLTRRLRHRTDHVGANVHFADGSAAAVYRETLALRGILPTVVLVVTFRLRGVRSGPGHAAFRLESVCNTVLFAGFDGFVSKLWLRHDAQGRYRGIYEWSDAARAARYADALRWPLALVADVDSIDYAIHRCEDRGRYLSGDTPTWCAEPPPRWSLAVAMTGGDG